MTVGAAGKGGYRVEGGRQHRSHLPPRWQQQADPRQPALGRRRCAGLPPHKGGRPHHAAGGSQQQLPLALGCCTAGSAAVTRGCGSSLESREPHGQGRSAGATLQIYCRPSHVHSQSRVRVLYASLTDALSGRYDEAIVFRPRAKMLHSLQRMRQREAHRDSERWPLRTDRQC